MSGPCSGVSAPVAARVTDGPDAETRPQRDVRALLERLADQLGEASKTLRELSETAVDVPADLSPVGGVETTTKTPAPGPEFLRVQDVAKRLHVDNKTIRRWRETGDMPPAFANGSIVRWRAEVIDEWIASQEGSP